MALIILCVSFFGFLVLGVPVAFAMGKRQARADAAELRTFLQ